MAINKGNANKSYVFVLAWIPVGKFIHHLNPTNRAEHSNSLHTNLTFHIQGVPKKRKYNIIYC